MRVNKANGHEHSTGMRRALAAFLVVSLCFTVLPVSADAEGDFAYTYPEEYSGIIDPTVPYDPLLEPSDVPPEERHSTDPASGTSFRRFSLLSSIGNPWYPQVLLSTEHQNVAVVFFGNYCLYNASGVPVLVLTTGATYVFSYANNQVTVSCLDTVLYSDTELTIKEHTPPSGKSWNYFTVYNTRKGYNLSYYGNLLVYINGTDINLVNRVYMEDYLRGVVPHEIGEGYGLAALQAQAVASRTYAYNKTIKRNASTHYDLVDTSSSQVYNGISNTTPNSDLAVQDTDRQILMYNGEVVDLYYSASNGGVTEIPSHSWSTSEIKAYNVIKTDSYDLAFARANGGSYINEIMVPKSGMAPSMELDAFVKAVIKEKYLLDDTVLTQIKVTSVKLEVLPNDYADLSEKAAYIAVYGDGAEYCSNFTKLNLTCNGVSGSPAEVNLEGVPIEVTTSELTNCGFTNTDFRCFWLTDSGTYYTIRHGRYGHGIGMSQIGARQMAKEGMNVDFILTFYYPGTARAVGSDSSREMLTALPTLSTEPRAVISDNYIYMRPNVESLTYGIARMKTALQVTGINGSFTTIAFEGKTGYVPKTTFDFSFSNIVIKNVTTSCNIREGASSASQDVGDAMLGSSYELVDAYEQPGWYKIKYGSGTAYISSQYALPVSTAVGTVIPDYPITVTPPSDYTDSILWVDGISIPATRNGSTLTATIHVATAKTVTMYKLRSSGTPESMYAWTLSYTAPGGYTATPLPADMQNLLAYQGCSIRVTGKTGIRFTSSIDQNLRARLIGDGVEGFKLLEYGTVVISSSSIGVYPFIKDVGATKFGRSYWDASNDYYTGIVGGRIRFASVRIDLPVEEYARDYGFRAYAIVTKEGISYTFYCGQVTPRSMYYVAKQVMAANEFAQGTAAYNFVKNIIDTVEG